ncbi:transporter substrate-binding domain-containing protein [Leadbettera azotonutricia]|uniref:transporter substrate-binding domain-containing protein n=1 Tax=Leadbettera azotonutricia TaxID=150829 RepID=UPI0002FBE42D|nr:transporter substrate-binding domain-containing protein [Leadbettera azotonutricia]
MKKIAVLALVLLAIGSVVFAGGSKDSKASASGVKTIRVGTEGAYPPYNYVREDGVVDGYDAAVIRAVDELIPEYTFEFYPTAWDGIFVALEGGDFDLIASDLAWRKEREDKYYLSLEPYLWGGSQLVYKAGRTDIHSLKDLVGKKVAAGVGTNTTSQLEDHIKQSGAKIEIVYTDGNIVNALTEIDSGRVDATISSIVTTQLTAESLGIKIDGSTIAEWAPSSIHLLFPKTPEGKVIRDRIDVALKQLHANGTLSSLSKKYFFGKDHSTKEALAADI